MDRITPCRQPLSRLWALGLASLVLACCGEMPLPRDTADPEEAPKIMLVPAEYDPGTGPSPNLPGLDGPDPAGPPAEDPDPPSWIRPHW